MVLCSQQMAGMYTNHGMDQDGHWQQFGTHPILISAPQWANRPRNAPTQLYRVGKKPSVKADMGIYSHRVNVLGQCMREPLIIGHNLDFSSCDIMVSCLQIQSQIIINMCPPYKTASKSIYLGCYSCNREESESLLV